MTARGAPRALLLTLLTLMFTATPAHAQEGGVEFSQILLTIAIVLGLASSVYVFSLSSRMAGSAIATTLVLYGVGMLGVVISLLSVTWLKPFMGEFAGFAHDGFFIVGFILMVLGSRKVAGIL